MVRVPNLTIYLSSFFSNESMFPSRARAILMKYLGSTHTLSHYLSTHLPLLFPPQLSHSSDLAYALIQGIAAPPETEMAWLGACLAGADGWVNICVGISR